MIGKKWLLFFLIGMGLLFRPLVEPAGAAVQSEVINVRVWPQSAEVTPNGTVEVAIEVVDVTDLYAFAAVLAFNPAVVQVVDVDPSLAGVQVALGGFMDSGAVILNLADNEAGVIEYAFTQLNPSPPKSGTGNLIVITFTGVDAGEMSPLIFLNVQLAQAGGIELAGNGIPGQIDVVNSPPPGPTSTPIPTQPAGIPFPTATFPAGVPPTAAITPLPTSTGEAAPLPSATTAGLAATAITTQPGGGQTGATGVSTATVVPAGGPTAPGAGAAADGTAETGAAAAVNSPEETAEADGVGEVESGEGRPSVNGGVEGGGETADPTSSTSVSGTNVPDSNVQSIGAEVNSSTGQNSESDVQAEGSGNESIIPILIGLLAAAIGVGLIVLLWKR